MNDPRIEYVAWMRRHAKFDLQSSGLKLAVDCSNGMSSLLVHDLLPGAFVLNDAIDGRFPCHSPNPLKPEAREQLSSCVREHGFDAGVIFDGDADRCMFVDENGDFIQPDYLIPIVARATRKALAEESTLHEAPVVLHDVRTSRGATETLRADGFNPAMVPVGHAFAKPKMRELKAICGGELAGHYYFGEFFGCDSGMLAALRILSEVSAAKERGLSFSSMMKPISGRYANSGELNTRVPDPIAALNAVVVKAKNISPNLISRSDIDGVRLDFREGWVNVRKSNTEPYLRLIVECDTKLRLDEWVKILRPA